MLINLIPDFFALLDSSDPSAAYRRYYTSHLRILEPYWRNYVLDPDTSHFEDVARSVMQADRHDLRGMLERTDVVSLARETELRCAAVLEPDSDMDVVLMVGVGAANAGELVTEGRGIAFVLPRAFHRRRQIPIRRDSVSIPRSFPLWLAHNCARRALHVAYEPQRTPRADHRSRWLLFLLGHRSASDAARAHVNEGIAVEVARVVSPGHAEWEYYGYTRRQYARIRELEGVLARAVAPISTASGWDCASDISLAG